MADTLRNIQTTGYDGNGSLTIVHWSDTHGGNEYTTLKAKELLLESGHENWIGIMTGDAYNGMLYGVDENTSTWNTNPWEGIKNRFLMCSGNHDAYDATNLQSQITKAIAKKATNSNIKWGDRKEVNGVYTNAPDVASYCYFDIKTNDADGNNRSVRIIVLDQYETTAVGLPSNVTVSDPPEGDAPYGRYDDLYSNDQIRWFVQTLKSMKEDGIDYFIIALHEPPSFNNDTDKDALQEWRRRNKFCSTKIRNWGTHNGGELSEIVEKYLNSEDCTISFNNFREGDPKLTNENIKDRTVNVFADFSTVTPAKFLFWMCGHMHSEACLYLPQHPNQLLTAIDCATWNNASPSDLARINENKDKPIINIINIDFETCKITITRHGLQDSPGQTYGGVWYDAITRDTISFDFEEVESEISPNNTTNFGLYAINDSFTANCPSGNSPRSSYVQKAVRKTKLVYNGDQCCTSFDQSNNFGVYVSDNVLVVNGAVVANTRESNAKLEATKDVITFGDALVGTKTSNGKVCINITPENYAKLLCGKTVPGYKKYNPKDVYNLVYNVEDTTVVYYNNFNGYEGLLYNNQVQDGVKDLNGNPIYHEVNNARTFSFTDIPFIGIREFDPHINEGDNIVMPVYIDSYYCDSTHNPTAESVSRTFTVIIKDSFDNELLKRTVYPGVTIFEFGPFKNGFNSNTNFEGETWFSLQVIDSRGVESEIKFFDILVRNKDIFDWDESTPSNWYKMTESDLTTYGITINNDDKYVGYRNKIGFTKLFAWCANNGYKGIKLYNIPGAHIEIDGQTIDVDYSENLHHYDSLDITKKGKIIYNGNTYYTRTDGCVYIDGVAYPIIPKCTYYISPHKNKNNSHSTIDVEPESIDLGSQTFYICVVKEVNGVRTIFRAPLTLGGTITYNGETYTVVELDPSETLQLNNVEASAKVIINGTEYPVIGTDAVIDGERYPVIGCNFDFNDKHYEYDGSAIDFIRDDKAESFRDSNNKIKVWYPEESGWVRENKDAFTPKTKYYYVNPYTGNIETGSNGKGKELDVDILATQRDGYKTIVTKTVGGEEIRTAVIVRGSINDYLNVKLYSTKDDATNGTNEIKYYHATDIPFYSVSNTAKHPDGDNATGNDYTGGDEIVFPDNFTVNLNNSTWRLTNCSDIRKSGCIVYLNKNINTHIMNGHLVGSMYFADFTKECLKLPSSRNGFQEHIKCVLISGNYCSLEKLDISYSMGYESSITTPDYTITSTSNTSNALRLKFNLLGHIDYNGEECSGQVIEPLVSNSESNYPTNYIKDSPDRYVKIKGQSNPVLDGSNSISLAYTTSYNRIYSTTTTGITPDVILFGSLDESNGHYFANGGKKQIFFIHCYNENQEHIVTMKVKMCYPIKIPADTKYVRFSAYGVSIKSTNESNEEILTLRYTSSRRYDKGILYGDDESILSNEYDANNSHCKSLENVRYFGRCYAKNNYFADCYYHDTRTIALYPQSIGVRFHNCKWERIAIEHCAESYYGFTITKMLFDFEELGAIPDRIHFKDCEVVWYPSSGSQFDYNKTHPRFAAECGERVGNMSTVHNITLENCKTLLLGAIISSKIAMQNSDYVYINNCENCGYSFSTGPFRYNLFRQVANSNFLQNTEISRLNFSLGSSNGIRIISDKPNGGGLRGNMSDDFPQDIQTFRDCVIYKAKREAHDEGGYKIRPRSLVRLVDSSVLDVPTGENEIKIFASGNDTYMESDQADVRLPYSRLPKGPRQVIRMPSQGNKLIDSTGNNSNKYCNGSCEFFSTNSTMSSYSVNNVTISYQYNIAELRNRFFNYCHSANLLDIEGCNIYGVDIENSNETLRVFYFDANRKYKTHKDFTTQTNGIIVIQNDTPAGTKYLRFEIHKNNGYTTAPDIRVVLDYDSNIPKFAKMSAPYLVNNQPHNGYVINFDVFRFETTIESIVNNEMLPAEKERHFDTGFITLPLNYDPDGEPSPLIVFAKGTSGNGFFGSGRGNEYIKVSEFLAKNGYAVADCSGITDKYAEIFGTDGMEGAGAQSYAIAIENMIKYIGRTYNVDTDGVYLMCKSIGGIITTQLAAKLPFKIKAIGMLSPALSEITSLSNHVPKLRNTAIMEADELGLGLDMFYVENPNDDANKVFKNADKANVLNNLDRFRLIDGFFMNTDIETQVTGADDDLYTIVSNIYSNGSDASNNLRIGIPPSSPINDKQNLKDNWIELSKKHRQLNVPVKIWIDEQDTNVYYYNSVLYVKMANHEGNNNPACLIRTINLTNYDPGSSGLNSPHAVCTTATYAPRTYEHDSIIVDTFGGKAGAPTALVELIEWFRSDGTLVTEYDSNGITEN